MMQRASRGFVLLPRPEGLTADLPDVRATWWRLRRHYDERLPAEPGVILIRGRRR
jgi:hypothetical protein